MQTDNLKISGPESKAVVFCADDFGMNRSINKGILKLAEHGRLSATSCMTKGASFFDDAPPLAELAVQKGLHLNLTEAQRETKFYQSLPGLIQNCYLHRLATEKISTEIDEQCDNFERAFGRPPDYVDGHQHVHQLPVVRDILLRSLKRRYGSDRIWIRSTRMPAGTVTWGDWMKSKLIQSLGASAMLHLATEAGFKTSRCLLGVYTLSCNEQRYRSRLDAWLALASPSDVLMCHPACGTDGSDPISRQREVEFAVLSDPSLMNLLAQHQARIAGAEFSII